MFDLLLRKVHQVNLPMTIPDFERIFWCFTERLQCQPATVSIIGNCTVVASGTNG